MSDRSPEMLKPTLIAGACFGTLGALPVVNLLNCACCALIISCGVFASYLFSRQCRVQGTEFRPGSGALVGLVAGLFYAMVHTLVAEVVRLLIGERIAQAVVEWVQSMPSIPVETRETIGRLLERSGAWTVLSLVAGFVVTLVLAAIFSTAGGLIGGALFRVAVARAEIPREASGGGPEGPRPPDSAV